MRASVTTLDAESAGEVELSDAIFGLEPRADLIQRMVRYQLLKRRAGTHQRENPIQQLERGCAPQLCLRESEAPGLVGDEAHGDTGNR